MLVICLLMIAGPSPGQEAPQTQQGEGSKGSGTIYGSVIQVLLDHRVGGASVYVFTLAQSRRLREMDEAAYRRAHAPGLLEGEDAAIEERNEGALVNLIPKFPRTAMAYSNIRGEYLFPNLPSGRRYCLVAFQVNESGVIFAVKVTPVLKNGEKLKVDIREDVPWKERFKVN
jgi:hypothetical protein